MAIYHCSIKIVSRGKGKSAVAAAAYRAGEKMTNDYDGITHDYTRKGGVVHTEILLPEHAPEEYTDRAVLWNAVEKTEKAKNSQLAREIELALPKELSLEQNISLVRKYVKEHFVSEGMCADICIHDKNVGNPHAHIMLTMRPFESNGEWGAKSKKEYVVDDNGERIKLKNGNFKTYKVDLMDWNEPTKAEEWRAAWADAVNATLERQGMEERVDHRSYKRQGIEQIPTVHMGVAAAQMERRGIVTDRGNQNREINATNNLLRQLWTKVIQLKDWLKQALTPTAPSTLAETLQGILQGGEQEIRYGRIRDLKTVARVHDYIRKNDISTMPELREKYSEVLTQYDNARGNVRRYERRLNTLNENIRQGGIYLEHHGLYDEYRKLKPRKQPKFYEAHRAELMLFEYAERYFKEHHVGTNFSLAAWKDEREKLNAEKSKVYREYNVLKSQFFDAEAIRYAAEQIVRKLTPQQKRKTRDRGMER